MNNNETTIQQWTIVFRIKENNLLYNDNKDSVLFVQGHNTELDDNKDFNFFNLAILLSSMLIVIIVILIVVIALMCKKKEFALFF